MQRPISAGLEHFVFYKHESWERWRSRAILVEYQIQYWLTTLFATLFSINIKYKFTNYFHFRISEFKKENLTKHVQAIVRFRHPGCHCCIFQCPDPMLRMCRLWIPERSWIGCFYLRLSILLLEDCRYFWSCKFSTIYLFKFKQNFKQQHGAGTERISAGCVAECNEFDGWFSNVRCCTSDLCNGASSVAPAATIVAVISLAIFNQL